MIQVNIESLSDKALAARLMQVRSGVATAKARLKEAQDNEKALLEEVAKRVESATNAVETATKTGGIRRETTLGGHTAYVTHFIKRDFDRASFDADYPGIYESYRTKEVQQKKVDMD